MKKNKLLLYFLILFFISIKSICHAVDFTVELKVNPSYTDCYMNESYPSKRLIDSVFKENIIILERIGVSANIIETRMLQCNYNWETKLLEWHVYDKDNYHVLLKKLYKEFKYLEMPADVFPLTIKSKNSIYDILRYPCKIFYKDINNSKIYIGMCEEKTGEIIIRYNLNHLR